MPRSTWKPPYICGSIVKNYILELKHEIGVHV